MSQQEIDQQISQVEISIEDAKETIELGHALNRLAGNKDFKKVIQEGYLENGALEQVKLLGHPNMQSPEQQADIMKELQSASNLHAYFVSIMQRADTMQRALVEHEATLEELHSENQEH